MNFKPTLSESTDQKGLKHVDSTTSEEIEEKQTDRTESREIDHGIKLDSRKLVRLISATGLTTIKVRTLWTEEENSYQKIENVLNGLERDTPKLKTPEEANRDQKTNRWFLDGDSTESEP